MILKCVMVDHEAAGEKRCKNQKRVQRYFRALTLYMSAFFKRTNSRSTNSSTCLDSGRAKGEGNQASFEETRVI